MQGCVVRGLGRESREMGRTPPGRAHHAPRSREAHGGQMLIGIGATLTSPIAGDPTISSLFGPRSQPTAGASTNHQGIDYAVPIGTPVLAAGAGTVIFAGVQTGFGNTVVIDNGNGVTTLYGHLSSIGVSQGQTVGDGDQIAASGNTGTTSGPNLHFQVNVNG